MTLIDAKTVPRHVLLDEAARELLNRLVETASGWRVLPGKNGDKPPTKHDLHPLWIKARDVAGVVVDVRLHGLRHRNASHVVTSGEGVHVAGRLLGHRRASTKARYLHLVDAKLSQVAERVAAAITRKLRAYAQLW